MFPKKQIILIVSLFFLIQISCNQKKNSEFYTINADILSLETIEDKEVFILNLFKADQEIRTEVSGILAKYGHDSKEYKLILDSLSLIDKLNFDKTKFYLETYAYPSCKVFKKYPCTFLIYIVGHQGNFETQKEVYSYFYTAYKSEELDEESMLWIVDEMYESKMGIHYPIPPTYSINPKNS